jgi:hypothetical protein
MLYGVSSSGMTLYVHYCCDKIEKIDLAPIKENGCDMGHKKPMKNCCEIKGISFKITVDQKSENSAELLIRSFQIEKMILNTGVTKISLPRVEKIGFTDSSPPYNLSAPVYILHCVFLI